MHCIIDNPTGFHSLQVENLIKVIKEDLEQHELLGTRIEGDTVIDGEPELVADVRSVISLMTDLCRVIPHCPQQERVGILLSVYDRTIEAARAKG